MSFWVLAALMTALAAWLVLTPLNRGNRPRLALLLTILLPLTALGIYFLTGNPNLLP